jgi:hypothetical protein
MLRGIPSHHSGKTVRHACPFTDPVGARVPKFSTNDKSSSFVINSGEGFGLLCLAQGFPIPTFRYVLQQLCISCNVQNSCIGLKCNALSCSYILKCSNYHTYRTFHCFSSLIPLSVTFTSLAFVLLQGNFGLCYHHICVCCLVPLTLWSRSSSK